MELDFGPIFAEDLLAKLDLNPWKTYIQVQAAEPEDRTAIEQLEQFLDPNKGIANIVEVTGIGGLGKTAIAREYMKRCIKHGIEAQPKYDYYFYYTSKDEQMEIQTTFGTENFLKPASWEEGGGGTIVRNLGFQIFLTKICTALNLNVDRRDLAEYLNKNQILLVLDNFEDVDEPNKQEYSDFFKTLNLRTTRSRVIVTSRKDRQFGGVAFELKLKHLDGIEATKLISERFNFYIGKDPSAYSLSVRTAIQEYVSEGRDLVEDVLNFLTDAHYPKVEDIQENLRHPLMLLRLASILASNLTAVETQSETQFREGEEVAVVRQQTIVSSLAEVIQGDYGFEVHEEEVMDWIIKKAYDDVMNDPFCEQILLELLQNEGGLTKVSIRDKLENNPEFQETSYIKGVNEGISSLLTHVVFLENETLEEEGDEVYILKASARRLIEKLRKNPNPAARNERNSAHSERKLDYTKPPLIDPKIATWSDINDYIKLIAKRTNTQFQKNLLSKSQMDDGKTNTEHLPTLDDYLNQCELAVFAKIEQTTPHHIGVNLDIIAQFLPFAKDRERAVSFSLTHAGLLAQNYGSLREETISYLASNWFGDAFSKFSELSELLRLEITVKFLHSAIQNNKRIISEHFITLIEEMDDQAIIDAYHEEAERALIRPHLERFADGIEWSISLQRVYDELSVYKTQGDQNSQSAEKFRSDIVQTYLHPRYSSYSLEFHDASPSKELSPDSSCFVCGHNKDERILLLYVIPSESLSESEHDVAPEDLTMMFNRWIRAIGKDLPGLSDDAVTLAADVLNGIEFHNDYFINNTNHSESPFTNATQMVKMFRTYQSVEPHAISMAFYIGYHSTGEPVGLDDVFRILKKEICERRLHRLSKQPNRYIPKTMITLMETRFSEYLSTVEKAISENSTAVYAQKDIRQKNGTKTIPVEKIRRGKAKITGTARRLPGGEKFEKLPINIRVTYLEPLIDRPIFGIGKLRADLVKLAGGDGVIRYEKTGRLSHWIDVIVSTVWSLNASMMYVRVTEDNIDDVGQLVVEAYNRLID